MARILVRPDFDAYYCSYYLAGISEAFGGRAARFARDAFPDGREPYALAFRLHPDGPRVFVDAQDASGIHRGALGWCDVYAKVNLDPGALPDGARRKVVAIGPGFGVRIWGLPRACGLAAVNALRSRAAAGGRARLREQVANYWRQRRYRLPIGAYVPGRAEERYVFHLASLWRDDVEMTRSNRYRANFIEACRALKGIEFEGGFAPRPAGYAPGYERFMIGRRYPLREYLEKTKRSLAVFNTPAVHGCLGWKLGEYLSLGKAIVSTPLGRELPAPLEHGTHAHFVDGSVESIEEAVRTIAADAAYRQRLERNARAYFEEHLAPAACIRGILKAAGADAPPGA